jgi:hypothetical protein
VLTAAELDLRGNKYPEALARAVAAQAMGLKLETWEGLMALGLACGACELYTSRLRVRVSVYVVVRAFRPAVVPRALHSYAPHP